MGQGDWPSPTEVAAALSQISALRGKPNREGRRQHPAGTGSVGQGHGRGVTKPKIVKRKHRR